MRHRTALLVLTTAAIVGACTGQTPTPSPSAEASAPQAQAATATPSPVATPEPSPEPSGTVRFAPGSTSPLKNAAFYALRPSADGFWLIGAEGYETPFLMKGSADGTTWTRLDIDSIAGSLADIAEGTHGTVLAQVVSDPNTGDQSTTLWFSADGTAFQPVQTQADLDKASVSNVFAGPSGFAAVGSIVDTSSENGYANRIWTSTDGRSWSSAPTPGDVTIDQMLITSQGYMAFETGANGSTPAEYVSNDGLTWSRGGNGSAGPFGMPDTNVSTPLVVGDELATVRSDGTVWTGNIGAGNAGPTVEWRHLADADPTFAGAQVVSAASSTSGATIIGFDRRSLQPAVWRSRNGVDWGRDAVSPSTFGGGAAMLLARSGDVDVTLGFEVNGDGVTVRRPWASSTGAWALSDLDIFGVMPAVASGPCPANPPTDPDKVAAIAAPLRPTCFGHRTLRLDAFAGSCECGGTTNIVGRPEWLANGMDLAPLYVGGRRPNDTDLANSLPVWIARGVSPANPPFGRAIAITGHFDDPASVGCRLFPAAGPPSDLEPKEAAIAQCRQHFVATTIRRR